MEAPGFSLAVTWGFCVVPDRAAVPCAGRAAVPGLVLGLAGGLGSRGQGGPVPACQAPRAPSRVHRQGRRSRAVPPTSRPAAPADASDASPPVAVGTDQSGPSSRPVNCRERSRTMSSPPESVSPGLSAVTGPAYSPPRYHTPICRTWRGSSRRPIRWSGESSSPNHPGNRNERADARKNPARSSAVMGRVLAPSGEPRSPSDPSPRPLGPPGSPPGPAGVNPGARGVRRGVRCRG